MKEYCWLCRQTVMMTMIEKNSWQWRKYPNLLDIPKGSSGERDRTNKPFLHPLMLLPLRTYLRPIGRKDSTQLNSTSTLFIHFQFTIIR